MVGDAFGQVLASFSGGGELWRVEDLWFSVEGRRVYGSQWRVEGSWFSVVSSGGFRVYGFQWSVYAFYQMV